MSHPRGRYPLRSSCRDVVRSYSFAPACADTSSSISPCTSVVTDDFKKSMSSLSCIWTSHCSKVMLKSVTVISFVVCSFALAN